jgi:hypothetical protein
MFQEIKDFNSIVPGYSNNLTKKLSSEGNPQYIKLCVLILYVILFINILYMFI